MNVDLFDFDLPAERIALSARWSRAMRRGCCSSGPQALADRSMSSTCPRCCAPGDCLVVNDTRVIPAQLEGHARLGRRRRQDRRDAAQARRATPLAGVRPQRPPPARRRRDRLRRRRARVRRVGSRRGRQLGCWSSPGDEPVELLLERAGPQCRCLPISRRGAPPMRSDAADYQTMFAARTRRRRCAYRVAALHSRPDRAAGGGGDRARDADAARRCGHLPAGQGGRHGRPPDCMPNGAGSTAPPPSG